MHYTNNIPYCTNNMYTSNDGFSNSNVNYFNPNTRAIPNNYYPRSNRFVGGFGVPFALGFLSAPLLLRPNYYPYRPYYPYPYYY